MTSNLTTLGTGELFLHFVGVLDELRRRGVTRSTNNPVGDYAEVLAEKSLNLTRAPKSTRGYDAEKAGERYEIKARRVTSHNMSRQLGAIRGLDRAPFAFLVGILFHEDFRVWKACVVPHATVLKLSAYMEHTNSWKLMLRDDVWDCPGVTDVTDLMRQSEVLLRG